MLERYAGIGIPLKHAKEFEKTVANLGGVFAEKQKRPLEAAEIRRNIKRQGLALEWSKQRIVARALVDKFKSKDSLEETGIKNRGVRKIIKDAFKYDLSRGKTFKKGVTPLEIKHTLALVFDESLPEDLPDNVVSGPQNSFHYVVIGDLLIPRRITFLIQSYGLDGRRRNFEEVAVENGVTLSVVKHVINNALSDLARNRRIRGLILEECG